MYGLSVLTILLTFCCTSRLRFSLFLSCSFCSSERDSHHAENASCLAISSPCFLSIACFFRYSKLPLRFACPIISHPKVASFYGQSLGNLSHVSQLNLQRKLGSLLYTSPTMVALTCAYLDAPHSRTSVQT